MILADNQIRELSTFPTFIVNKAMPALDGFQYRWVNIDEPTHLSEEEIIRLIEKHKHLENTGIKSYRVLTDEEKDNFKPMVSPFTNGQVKMRSRLPSSGELHIWNTQHKSSSDDAYLPDNWIPDNSGGLKIEDRIISYGLSSYGYDLRCGHKFKIFSNINAAVVDPKDLDTRSFVDVEVEKDGDYVIVPPNSFALTYSLERIAMPKDVTAIVLGKSTYARTGLICIATPLEAGWEGYVTLEFANSTPLPMKLYAGEGCCQVLFFKGDVSPDVSYADRNGKYQNQGAEVTLPKV